MLKSQCPDTMMVGDLPDTAVGGGTPTEMQEDADDSTTACFDGAVDEVCVKRLNDHMHSQGLPASRTPSTKPHVSPGRLVDDSSVMPRLSVFKVFAKTPVNSPLGSFSPLFGVQRGADTPEVYSHLCSQLGIDADTTAEPALSSIEESRFSLSAAAPCFVPYILQTSVLPPGSDAEDATPAEAAENLSVESLDSQPEFQACEWDRVSTTFGMEGLPLSRLDCPDDRQTDVDARVACFGFRDVSTHDSLDSTEAVSPAITDPNCIPAAPNEAGLHAQTSFDEADSAQKPLDTPPPMPVGVQLPPLLVTMAPLPPPPPLDANVAEPRDSTGGAVALSGLVPPPWLRSATIPLPQPPGVHILRTKLQSMASELEAARQQIASLNAAAAERDALRETALKLSEEAEAARRDAAQLKTSLMLQQVLQAREKGSADEGRGQHEQAVREEVTALRDSISELQGEKEVMQGQLRALRAELKQSKLEQQRLRAQREVAVEGVLERGVNGGAETIVEVCDVLAPCVAAAIPAPAPMATHMLKNMPTNMPRVGVARPALALRTESFAQSLPAPKHLIAKKAAYDAAWHGDVQMHLRHAF